MTLKDQIRDKDNQIANLKFENAQLKRLIFSSKKETHKSTEPPSEQGNLFDQESPSEEVQTSTETITYNRKKASTHKGRNKLPSHLPVEEVIIEPAVDTANMKKIGEEVTDTLDYTPGSLKIIRTRRIKYARKKRPSGKDDQSEDQENQQPIVIAPAPQRPIDKCIAETRLLAYIIVSKFIDHLPFYRQIQRFRREFNWHPSKSTLNDWFIAVCTLLQPLYDQLEKELLTSSYIQADESPIKVQDKKKPGKTHQGYQWVYHSPVKKIVLFKYHRSRSHHAIKEILQEYSGWVQCDGYTVYDKLKKWNKDIKLAGCWVHARRKYFQAKDSDATRAKYALDLFTKVYHHEAECRSCQAEDRQAYRTKHITPLIAQLYQWIEEESIKVLPKSPMGKAMNYTLKQKEKLMACFQDGILELDNNLIENKIRPLALGRKNYLFAGSHAAGQRIAMMYTFFATCKANDVNPLNWLTHTLDNIKETKLTDLSKLLPQNLVL